MNNKLLQCFVSFVVVLTCVAFAEACPNCKENLAGDPTSEGLAQGFYYSILFMVSMPFLTELLEAGVDIREYVGGLLHSKTFTVDGAISLIGSANMDRRSFDLNFENNILIYDPALTRALRTRQQAYIDSAVRVSLEEVENWPLSRRLWNNSIAMLGPIL